MSDQANQRVNKIYDEVRDALKEQDGDKYVEQVAAILTKLANVAEAAVVGHKDPGFALASYFGGFSAIAMMFGALPDDTKPEIQLQYIRTVVALITNALSKTDKEEGDTNGEA